MFVEVSFSRLSFLDTFANNSNNKLMPNCSKQIDIGLWCRTTIGLLSSGKV